MDSEEITEIEIDFEPRIEQLEALGITLEEFTRALPQILEKYHDMLERSDEPDKEPSLYELEVFIKGKKVLLSDIAEIQLSGDEEVIRNLKECQKPRRK